MRIERSTYLVVSEFGTDWFDHADFAQARFADVTTLVQNPVESPHEFTLRVREKLAGLGKLRGATLLCSEPTDRRAIAGRRELIDTLLHALSGVAKRELSIVCEPTRNGRLPGWVAGMGQGIEERDPALELFVECAPHRAAA